MKNLLYVLTLSLFFSCSKSDETPVDTIAPIITLLGDSSVTIALGTPYDDAGATAVDNTDGDLNSSISVSNPVDINILGIYNLTYNVSDSSGNSAMATRTVNVVPASFNTYTLGFGQGLDLETEMFNVTEIAELLFEYEAADPIVHARIVLWGGGSNMAFVYDKSFDELSLFYISNYYFCTSNGDTDSSCNFEDSPDTFVALFYTFEGNYIALDYLSESDTDVTFRYKILD